jgi:hypothetical protein
VSQRTRQDKAEDKFEELTGKNDEEKDEKSA